jgi:membrane-bound lytic murein transglycosylase D
MNRPVTRFGLCPLLLRVLLALAACLFLAPATLVARDIPRPKGLEPEVRFWRTVFAECTTEQGLIHDNRHLQVVYQKVDASGVGGAARVAALAEREQARYARILRQLATGQRTGLDAEAERVLALWGPDVSNAELQQAAERVRFQQGLADRFQEGLRRSGLWRAHILESLNEVGVPAELVALPHVESSFNPEARSFVGAAGLWQFTRDTGRRFMRIDQAVDERRDPFVSSEAAARLLKSNHQILKSWPLAITAYNHGAAGMRRAAEATGTTNIETIVRRYDGRAFGFASRNFYVSFLAALEIDRDPQKFFGAVQLRPPEPHQLVELKDYVRADTLQRALGVSRETLESYNPALLPPVWSGAKYVPRGFVLRLPASVTIDPAQAIASLAPSQRYASQVADRSHRVRRGDTLSRIAQRYGLTVSGIARANGIRPGSRIRVGQVLKLPGVAPAPVAVAVNAPPAAKPAAAEPPPPAPTRAGSYVVRAGDTVGAIAARTGVSQRDLLAWNGLPNANLVRKGQRLRLTAPDAAGTGPTATVAAVETPAPAAPEPVAAVTEADQAARSTAPSLADPADYLVADDDTVEVQAAETLSHLADWLEVTPAAIRTANGWRKSRNLLLGQRVRLVFSKVSRDTFLSRRVAYHHGIQEAYFDRYRITATTVHRLRRGESVWVLAADKYKIPVWLLRQYNPRVNLNQITPGTRLVFPRVQRVTAEGPGEPAVARNQ